jgi:hypothetical protein
MDWPIPMEGPVPTEAAPYQWRRPLPMEEARINGGGPYQMEEALTNGGGPYLFKIYRKGSVYAPGAPRPLATSDAPVRVTV